MTELLAKDALSRRVIFGLPEQRLQDLLPEVYQASATHCAVQPQEGELRGIIRIQDALRISPYRILADLLPPDPCPTIRPQQPLADAATLCLENQVDALAVIDDDGSPVGVVTNESLLEASLRSEKTRAFHAENRFRKILENTMEGIFQCDRDGNLLRANPAFVRMLRLESWPTIRDNDLALRDLFVESDEHNNWHSELDHFGIVQAMVTKWRTQDGESVWVELSTRLSHNNSDYEARIEGVVIDVSERVTLESQLRQAQKLSTIGQLAGGVAHDFNNLLTVIRMNTDLLLQKPSQAEEVDECISQITTATDSAAEITKQLLTLSRDQDVDKQLVSVNETVAKTLRLMSRIVGEKVTMDFDPARDLPLVHADPGMLSQVLLNLIVNARDAMPEEGGHIHITTALTSAVNATTRSPPPSNEYICIDIEDTGVGIDSAHLPRIFEPFFSARLSGQGTGLGLATVDNIVRQHGGWAHVDSEPGRGTKFSVFLPGVRDDSLTQVDKENPRAVSSHHHGKVLLVEDMDDLRQLMHRALSQLGLDVVPVSSGIGALEAWHHNDRDFDLLFTDCMLPDGMMGPELARRLADDKPELKVVFTSGSTTTELDLDLGQVPDSRFIQKPFDITSLAQLIDDLLPSP